MPCLDAVGRTPLTRNDPREKGLRMAENGKAMGLLDRWHFWRYQRRGVGGGRRMTPGTAERVPDELPCGHSTADAYLLSERSGIAIGFCRHEDCHGWRITFGGQSGAGFDGQGLERYRGTLTVLAANFPDADVAFLYDLGGHAAELDA